MSTSDPRSGKKPRFTRRKKSSDLDALYDVFRKSKEAEGRAKGTLERYDEAYHTFTRFLHVERGAEKGAEAIKTELIREWSAWLLNDCVDVSRRTASDKLRLIRTFFTFLYEEEHIDHNPFDRVKAISYNDPEIHILEADELKALLNAPNRRSYAGFRDYVLMTFLIDTMARINEACNLHVENIDFKARTVMLPADTVKTRKMRIVPATARTVNLLRELMNEVEDFESEYVFLTNYGARLPTSHFRHRLRDHAVKAGIKKRVHPHLFRHTSATMFLEAGGDSQYLKMILGHSDEKMLDIYSHLRTKSISEAHERYSPLEQVVSPQQKKRKVKR